MPIFRPDIYAHNNPNEPIVDTDFVKGGFRTKVADLPALYALAPKVSQMKEHATSVWVISENKYYTLVDASNVGSSSGWSDSVLGSGVGASTFTDLTDTPSTYTGQSGKKVVVNAGETALEFVEDNAVPTNTSDLTNDGADGTSTYVETDELGAVAFSNDYSDLDGLPTIPPAYVHPNHSGDVTSVGDGVQTIANQAVTNAKFRDSTAHTVVGRAGAGNGSVADITLGNDTILGRQGSGNVEGLSVAQVQSMINFDAKVDKAFLPLALTGNINVSTLEQNRVYVATLGGSDRTITIDVPTNILFILNSANTLTFAGSVTPLNDDLTLAGVGNSMLIEYLSGANSLASKKGFTQINPDDYPLNNFPQPATQRFLRDGIDRKADIVAGASFTTGTPRTFAVTFGTAFSDANYAIKICGVDSRQWSYQSKSASGFTINSNSGTALTGEVTWTAEKI